MPHALSLSYKGVTTSLSNGTSVILNNYVPSVSSPKNGEFDDVTETVEITVIGASVAAVTATVRNIEQLLTYANDRQKAQRGPRVWINYTPNGDSLYRSELLEGMLTPTKSASLGYNQRMIGFRLHISRRYWWEGPRTQIPLTNSNGTGNTSGLTIYNHDDGGVGHDNYLQIAATDIIGSLPSPIELQLTNADGSTRFYRNFYLTNNRLGTSLAHVIEGEMAIAGYGTVTSNASASNGQYAALTGSGWLTFRWYVPTASLEIIRGEYVRVLARMFTFPSAAREMHLKIFDWSGLIERTQDQLVWSNTIGSIFWQSCGAVRLPPTEMGEDVEAWKDVVLELKVKTSGTETIGVDFLMLMPVENGCFRHIVQEGYGIANGEVIVDGGFPTQTYAYDGVNRFEIFTPQTDPLMIWPNVAQRIYVAWDGTGGSIDWKLTAKAYYRPRRLTF